MKRIALFFSTIIVVLLFLLNNSVYASKNRERSLESSLVWFEKSYSPDLNLQPYFDFKNLGVLAAAPCVVQSVPFWEGFNTDSTTYSCWTIIDANKDSSPSSSSKIWRIDDYDYYEGDQSMYFYGSSKNDDWLISPAFKLDATKTYKLRYRYLADPYTDNEFEVLASNKGIATSDFTKTLVTRRIYENSNWMEETVFITNYAGDVNIAWHVTGQSGTSINIDNVFLDEIACVEPQNLDVKSITTQQATIFWNDAVNKSWEYYVEDTGGNGPANTGVTIAKNEAVVTKDNNNKNLVAGNTYDFYVRAKCANGSLGEWIGPFTFKTLCSTMNAPLVEGFNTKSTTFGCWIILDNNKDAASPTDTNIWRQYDDSNYEGDRMMYFSGSSSAGTHDDWLISPTVKMNGGIYAITYYYKTSGSNDNEFEVVLSKSGVSVSSFTTVLEAKEKKKANAYTKKTLYVQNTTGDINIAWHVVAESDARIYIDLVSIQEVSCIAPEENVIISDIEKDKANVSWTDTKNSSWEYFVQDAGAGPVPVGSGSLATKTIKIPITKTNGPGGGNLQPNTEYEIFIRSSCGPGKNSLWIGPIKFKTPCAVGVLPFWEGFNNDSTTIDCWSIVDNNKDATEYSKTWMINGFDKYEGDQSMYFTGSWDATEHDDWLISPTFKLDATKLYRVKYHYKANSSEPTDFEVLLSNKGVALGDFTTSLMSKKGYIGSNWVTQTHIIGNQSGNVNIAWHVNTQSNYSDLFIDNVFIEEVIGCAEPISLDTKDIKETSATVAWTDDYGKNWEYVVQKSGGKVPVAGGTATAKKDNNITKEQSGANLLPNTEYEFYTRTVCGNGEYSIWSGPFKFRTSCGIFTTPFAEGFNNNSTSIYCWTITDVNMDAENPTDNGIWRTASYGQFEGSHAMNFSVYDDETDSDDWLITPTIKFDKNKIYRLKYHFKTDNYSVASEFEVLASNTGTKPADFKKEIVKNQLYKTEIYQQKTVFITNLDGNVNLAWHVKGLGSKNIYIDNIFVEEVTGCPEPLNLDVKDVESKKATITWTDDFNATSWEYYVQEDGKSIPTTNGTVTNKKENTFTKDQSGKNLIPNTDYEYYVRTVCGNGSYSIWAGPFKFVTLCDVFNIPFKEGFNKDSSTIRCWTIIDGNNDGDPMWGGNQWGLDSNSYYEGNQSMNINVSDWDGDKVSDDWLISPNLTMQNSMYVLKYHYQVSDSDGGAFEVLLSNSGITTDKFTTTIIGREEYTNGNWVEEVKFFTGVAGTVNIAWHMDAIGFAGVNIDNITLKKVETCPEPYHVTVSNQTTTGMDLEWKQDGGITSWEVIVVNYGDDETATPVKSFAVAGNPKITISGLNPGSKYTIYVRTKCPDGKSNSEWSTPVDNGTKVGVNDNCNGALNIPVNNGGTCEKSVTGSFFGSTTSSTPEPTCGTNEIKKDVWFEFTATNTKHLLNISDYFSISKASFSTIFGSIYSQDCSQIGATALECFELEDYMKYKILENLVVGQKYYIRLATMEEEPDFYFNLCIYMPSYIDVSLSGDKYTVEQLVKEVLVVADCDLVSNVTYSTGTNFGNSEPNGIGYFAKNNSSFAFNDGIVLATNGVETAKGPGDSQNQTDGSMQWLGDLDLQNLLFENGQFDENFNASVIEFDFIPITDTIKFDFIFASNEYGPQYQCDYSDVFAFFLTDLETTEMTNLAVVPGTKTPVSVTTIRDAKYQGTNTCGNTNEKYFDKYYGEEGLETQDNPINYGGMTVPMKAISAVKPGKKYHIKLAIADYRDSGYNSAVFLKGGSFDLGKIDLGKDLLVDTGNALCSGESRIIKSGVMTDGVVIKWFKDDVLIPGADKPDLEVFETGTYKITVKYLDLNCESTGTVKVEIYPPISTVVNAPVTLPICRNAMNALIFDLTEVESKMLTKVDPVNYAFVYYKTKADAVAKINAISDPKSYEVETTGVNVLLYIQVEDVRTGCIEIFEWTLKATAGTIPASREDVVVCANYTFPALEKDQYYYTGSVRTGNQYKAADVLSAPGSYKIYVLQDNGGGCYEEISYKLSITAPVKADVFEDVVMECGLHSLAVLSENNKYFTQAGGQGIELAVGSLVPHAQTIYVFASSEDGLCTDESSFKVNYADCPIQKGISPNGDGLNDSFDLSLHGVTSLVIYNRYGSEVFTFQGEYLNQWKGQDKNKNLLPDGTYFYVAIAHGKTKSGWVQINK